MPLDENESVESVQQPDTRSNEQLDALADAGSVATNKERPMSEKPSQGEKAPAASEEPVFEFTHAGKQVKATKEQLIKWAQQGYNYPQLVQKLNQDKTKWQQDRETWEKQWGVYKQIDDYARSNQEWWNHVQQSWQNKGSVPVQGQTPQAPGQADPYAPKFQALEQKLSQFEQLAQTLAEEKRVAQEREEDQKLEQEIQSIREQHKDLDWQSLDENGKSLEVRVLEHQSQLGTSSFRAALRDLLHEDLVTKAQAQAKIAVAKGIQTRTKLGVLGESPTPFSKRPSQQKPIRQTSYEDLEREIREEIAMGRMGK